MSVQLECIGCREIKEFPRYIEFPLCKKCRLWEIQHILELQKECAVIKIEKPKAPDPVCQLCGYTGPAIDHHHIHGKKVSNETVIVCANCHREIHAGIRTI
jgi:hypothetical protein